MTEQEDRDAIAEILEQNLVTPHSDALAAAGALIEAGFSRHAAETAETVAQLDALPIGSVIIDPFDEKGDGPVVACKDRWNCWRLLGSPHDRTWNALDIVRVARKPLIVAYRPVAFGEDTP